MIKEIIFFSIGDSNSLSTWSNVPFFFAKTLEEYGIVVHRYDLTQQQIKIPIVCLYKTWFKILRLIYSKHVQNFHRTRYFKAHALRIINNAVKRHPSADCCLFMGYDFYNKFSSIPTILFSDWTSDMYFERVGRKPYWFERRYIKQQELAIANSSLTFSLFELCAKKLHDKYPQIPIEFLKGNVINVLEEPNKQIIERKKSGKILLIGGRKYINGAKMLIEAFNLLTQDNKQISLHIIGMQKKLFSETDLDTSNVHFYGYLKKDVEKERKQYYDLISTAQIVVNPSPLWAGYSSTIEAMYYYTPIIVSPYEEFVNEFGNNINFGLYTDNTIEKLAENINSILHHPHYTELCLNAHNRVSNYTWNHYIGNFLFSINRVLAL